MEAMTGETKQEQKQLTMHIYKFEQFCTLKYGIQSLTKLRVDLLSDLLQKKIRFASIRLPLYLLLAYITILKLHGITLFSPYND